jgi:hypothetical protein
LQVLLKQELKGTAMAGNLMNPGDIRVKSPEQFNIMNSFLLLVGRVVL